VIAVSAELAGVVVMNALVVGVSWGFLRRDVTATRRDVLAIKKALGLEPVNGKIEAAFVPTETCHLREERISEKVDELSRAFHDHARRIREVDS
jgi:hypothetical protein